MEMIDNTAAATSRDSQYGVASLEPAGEIARRYLPPDIGARLARALVAGTGPV
jgi:hypothetical protein